MRGGDHIVYQAAETSCNSSWFRACCWLARKRQCVHYQNCVIQPVCRGGDFTLFHKNHAIRDLKANCISWVTITIVMPSLAKSSMTFNTSPTNSGSSAEVVHQTTWWPVSLPEHGQLRRVVVVRLTIDADIDGHELTELVHGKEERTRLRRLQEQSSATRQILTICLQQLLQRLILQTAKSEFWTSWRSVTHSFKRWGQKTYSAGRCFCWWWKVTDVYAKVAKSDFEKGYVVIKKG